MKSRTSVLLSGPMWGRDERHDEPQRIWRGTIQRRAGYVCRVKGCNMIISNFEDALVANVLAQVGDDLRWQRVQRVATGGEAELPQIERRLDELSALIRAAGDRDERARLREQEDALLDLRDEKHAEGGEVEWVADGDRPLLPRGLRGRLGGRGSPGGARRLRREDRSPARSAGSPYHGADARTAQRGVPVTHRQWHEPDETGVA